MKTRLTLLALSCTAALSGCVNLAPRYERPAAPVPAQFSAGAAADTGAALPAPAGGPAPADATASWRAVYTDARLQRVIAQALDNNRDLRIAVLTIEKARAEYRIQASELFPSILATAEQTASRSPASAPAAASAAAAGAAGTASAGAASRRSSVSRVDSAEVGFSSYELDLFGRLRNLSDEARETYLATDDTRRSTQISLIAEVATAWQQLAADQRLLALSHQMLDSQQQTRDLIVREQQLGAASALDQAQAEGALQGYRNDVAAGMTTVAKDQDALSLLVGAAVAPEDLPGNTVESAIAPVAPPAELSSTVLLQRPDVLAAEHQLKAANADVGAARADFFPQITLTASTGTASRQLNGLFKAGSRSWSFAPSISLPIFDGGERRGALDEAKAEKSIQVATYEKTIQTAFSEVADALAEQSNIATQVDAEGKAVAADQSSYDLAQALYKQGSYSLLDVLTVQRTLYTDQRTQVAVQLEAQTSMSMLYKSLGGGWR